MTKCSYWLDNKCDINADINWAGCFRDCPDAIIKLARQDDIKKSEAMKVKDDDAYIKQWGCIHFDTWHCSCKAPSGTKCIKACVLYTMNKSKCPHWRDKQCNALPHIDANQCAKDCPYYVTVIAPQEKSDDKVKKEELGKKYDSGKARWDLLPMRLIDEVVDVLSFGADKYGEGSWQYVENGLNRYYAALMRHIRAYREGEENDVESGLSHLAHAMCNIIFLSEFHYNAENNNS